MNMAQMAKREAGADKQQQMIDAWAAKVAGVAGIVPDEELALAMYEDGFSIGEAAEETIAQAAVN